MREALRRDLGERFTERPVEGGHILYWDAFDETVAAIRPFLVPRIDARPGGATFSPMRACS